MASSNTKTTNPADFDVRVRERNLRKGTIDEKAVEAYIAQLPDVADAVEYISVPQPALGGGNG
jgi:hypothetical protein